jgi:hypothetical protein
MLVRDLGHVCGEGKGRDFGLPGRYRPACRMTQTGARSVSSPIGKSIDISDSSESYSEYLFLLTSSSPQDQIVLHRGEIV